MDITTIWCLKATKKRLTKCLLKHQSVAGERVNMDTFINILLDDREKVKE